MTLPYHAETATAVAVDLRLDPTVGLATDAAERRAAKSGPNALETAKREPLWRMLLKAATEPFVLMLALASVLAIVVGEVRDGILVPLGLRGVRCSSSGGLVKRNGGSGSASPVGGWSAGGRGAVRL